jgi:penicillin amidase
MAGKSRRTAAARVVRRLLAAALLLAGTAAVSAAAFGTWVLWASRPLLDGKVAVAGLAVPVSIERDSAGVPTVIASNRLDLARALGFLHGQERFFQMDLLRRAGAGELSGLVGSVALSIDRQRRLHRFRSRAEAALAGQTSAQRALVNAYASGVNAGLAALVHSPWEYTLLRTHPAPWTEADTYLVVYAMYFDLQASDASAQETRAVTRAVLGDALAAFLNPPGTAYDAAIDGSTFPDPPLPAALPAVERHVPQKPGEAEPAIPARGSNNFAVSGHLTATGSAMVANDMHLALMMPNIWYRARMQMRGDNPADLVGVTLPGSPFLIVGSNTHIAWGFTDGYIETGDAVLLDMVPGDPSHYRTPNGPQALQTLTESLCPLRAACENLAVEETIWGPIVSHTPEGMPVVWRWTAHDPQAVMIDGLIRLEASHSVREALDAAHTAGMPQQNLVVGDTAGHVAWTIIGQVPRRVGLDDQVPHSWADGTHRWDGYLAAAEIPEIVDPPGGRLWTANARVVGGHALERLGDGGYAEGMRAGKLRDDLAARPRFTEADLFAIENDDQATMLGAWQKLLLGAIHAHATDPRIAAMQSYAAAWGGEAIPTSVGYRLVEAFRKGAIRRVLGGLLEPVASRLGENPVNQARAEWPVERLLTERPAALVPPPYKDWDALTGAVLDTMAEAVERSGSGLPGFTWGVVNHVGIHHPLARAVPLLGLLTDPPDVPEAGDAVVPRVAIPGFGASERLVVSPGHEASGLINMPLGEADNPLTPYYGAGQSAWVAGSGTALLPGAARWRLMLEP